MNNTWVKLYRKLNESDIVRDANALQLFIWLLINVDKSTGEIVIGRGWLSKYLKQNPNTFYAVVTRLRHKYHMVETTTVNNNQATKIRLLNWAKYQSPEDRSTTPDKDMTNGQQLSDNTLQEIKNKEDINIYDENKNSDEFSEVKKMLGLKDETSKGGINYEFQNQALELIEALGIPSKRKSAYFKAVKEYPRNQILDAYAYAIDHPNVAARDKMFFWKLSDLRKAKDAASN